MWSAGKRPHPQSALSHHHKLLRLIKINFRQKILNFRPNCFQPMPGWNGCHPGKRCLREFIIESIFDSSEQKYEKLNLLGQNKIIFQIWKILFIKSKNFAPFLTVVKNWFNRLKHSARYVTNILKNLHIYQTQAGLSPKLDQFKNKVWSQKEVHLKRRPENEAT